MLSAEGKTAEIGRLVATERRRRAGIVQAATERATTRRADLERKLFRLPSGADATATVSYRDALDRAEQVDDPAELARLIDRAVVTGDQALGRAAMARAYSRYNTTRRSDPDVANAWRNAAASYIKAAPGHERDALAELDALDRAGADPHAPMRTSIAASVQAPPELSHLQPHQVDAMADTPADA
jgi:hypothetical protein